MPSDFDSQNFQMELFDVEPLTTHQGEIKDVTTQVNDEFGNVGLDTTSSKPQIYEASLPTYYQEAFGWDERGNLILGWIPIAQIYGAYDPERRNLYVDRSVTGSDQEKRRILEQTGIPVLSLREVFGHEYRHHAENTSGIMRVYEGIAEVASRFRINIKETLIAFIEGLTQYLTAKKLGKPLDEGYQGAYAGETRAMDKTVRDYGLRYVMNPFLGKAREVFETFVNYWTGLRQPAYALAEAR